MSGIAELLLNLGYKVSGSDLNSSAITEKLNRLATASNVRKALSGMCIDFTLRKT